jgi:hypothetical protein
MWRQSWSDSRVRIQEGEEPKYSSERRRYGESGVLPPDIDGPRSLNELRSEMRIYEEWSRKYVINHQQPRDKSHVLVVNKAISIPGVAGLSLNLFLKFCNSRCKQVM